MRKESEIRNMKYSAKITKLGAESLLFLDDENCNFIIIFNENAPKELADISVLHEHKKLLAAPKKGDIVVICEKVFTVTDVGYEVINTLEELGHCTLSFKGKMTVDRPGIIELSGDPISADDIYVGGYIEIY